MKKLFLLITLIFTSIVFAQSTETPLTPDQAFQVFATAKNDRMILVQFKIAPHYFLYRQHFQFKVIKPLHTTLGDPLYPNNFQKLNTALGVFDVYSNTLTIPIPVIHSNKKGLILQIHYQGCSQSGYCYPPKNKIVSINLAGNYLQPAMGLHIDVSPTLDNKPSHAFENLLTTHSLFLVIVSFFAVGLMLSLTPCVLPMIPILSSMIIGKEKNHAFLLSLCYVMGMAITYSIAGVLFGILGSNVQTLFQQSWIIFSFSGLFVLMALSLFGLFTLQLPEKLRSRIAAISYHQKSSYINAALMGVLSTLILSPCVTPPLVAVLGFISHSGDAMLGGTALFTMGIGMGAPLLLIGAVGPALLPKSGAWMNTVKNLMGVLLLAVAIFMLQRVLSDEITMMLWATLSLATGFYLTGLTAVKKPWKMLKKTIGLLLLVYGILLAVSVYFGNTNPLRVLFILDHSQQTKLVFQSVNSVSDVESALKSANDKIVMLDFSADWCVTCKELDALTFSKPAVQARFSQFVLLRANVTNSTLDNQLLEQHYNVVAPPTILFFKNNVEIPNSRIIGYQSESEFLKHLNTILQ